MKKLFLLAFLVLLLPCVAQAGDTIVTSPGTNEPYFCGCADDTPLPDQGTLNVINNFVDGMGPWTGTPHPQGVGDQITVCNSGGCATYTKTTTGIWGQGSYSKSSNNGGGGSCHATRAIIQQTAAKFGLGTTASGKSSASDSGGGPSSSTSTP